MKTAIEFGETVRKVCLQVAMDAYENAGISGLCAEGRWECAVQAIKALDIEKLEKEIAARGE